MGNSVAHDTSGLAPTPWMRADEAASYAKVHVRTVYRACRLGQLKCARIGGGHHIRTKAEWISDWLEREAARIPAGVARHVAARIAREATEIR